MWNLLRRLHNRLHDEDWDHDPLDFWSVPHGEDPGTITFDFKDYPTTHTGFDRDFSNGFYR